MDADSSNQRISRLTPLGEILSLVEARAQPVRPREIPIETALGCTLADDVVASQLPPHAIALRDGFAVEAILFADAGPYVPVPLPPSVQRVDVGDPLPARTDAVLPLDAVTRRHGRHESVVAVAPGEGILPAGGDVAAHAILRRVGDRVRAVDVAVFQAAGIDLVTVRAPRVGIAHASAAATPVTNAALAALTGMVARAGGLVADKPVELSDALADDQFDAVIGVGGTGCGPRDISVQALARCGRVEAHGIAISPGETSAFGFASGRPVLLAPGRLDAAFAAWLLIGRPLIAKLAASKADPAPLTLPLKRKVTSAIGLTELIPVGCAAGMVQPLASGYLSFEALARSDGWIVIPADSEGLQAGGLVAIEPWP